MTKNEIRTIVSKYTTNEMWDDESNIFEDLEIDSLDFIKIIVEIETKLDLEIPSEFLEQERWKNINTILDNIQYLRNRL